LDNDLGALVAWKEGDIEPAIPEVIGDGIEDGIEFGMADIGILGIKIVPFSGPGQLVIRAAPRKTVVSDPDDLVLTVGDTGSYLGVRVLGTVSGKDSHCHEIFIPGEIPRSLCDDVT